MRYGEPARIEIRAISNELPSRCPPGIEEVGREAGPADGRAMGPADRAEGREPDTSHGHRAQRS